MLPQLLLIGYGLLFLSYIVAAIFIVFHLIRYSFNKSSAGFTISLFLAVTGVLVLANVTLFFAIPWNKLFTAIGITF